MNFGYKGEVLIPSPLKISEETKAGDSLQVKLNLSWLACKEECLPGDAKLSLSIPVKTVEEPATQVTQDLFHETLLNIPSRLDHLAVAVEETDERLTLGFVPTGKEILPSDVTFYPEEKGIVKHAGAQLATLVDSTLKISLERDPHRKEPISRIRGVLVSDSGFSPDGFPKAIEVDTEKNEAAASENLAAPLRTGSGTSAGVFLTGLIYAFLGGLLLNLMPCVFPILSIKVLSFLHMNNECRKKSSLHAGIFSLGVILSCVFLAGLMLILRASGETIGWGFQLQSATFVSFIVVLFFAMGIFFITEIPLFNSLQNTACRFKTEPTLIGSFLSGILATAVATPCTAPFMGTALGFTLTAPPAIAILIFAALGLGISSPYILFAAKPELLRFLPRPGAWMLTFKELMAFPLFAASIFFFQVFTRLIGVPHSESLAISRLLFALLCLAFSFWLLMIICRSPNQVRKLVIRILAAVFFLCAVFFSIPKASVSVYTSKDQITDSYGLTWKPYSENTWNALLAEGKPVFIDFTAAWCITCQVNKELVWSSEEVRKKVTDLGITLVEADWTTKSDEITRALARYRRTGVPLNLLFIPGEKEPIVFPALLTAERVLSELQRIDNAS